MDEVKKEKTVTEMAADAAKVKAALAKVEFKGGTFVLRAHSKHPTGQFHIQAHVLTRRWKKFELSAAEEKELAQPGVAKWVEIGTLQKLADEERMLKRAKKLDKEEV